MRLRLFSPWLAGAVVAIAGGWWLHESATHAALQARADALAREERELGRLQAERERLRDQLVATEAQVPAVSAAPVARAAEAPTAFPNWQRGEWTAATAWSNEGRATPKAAIATLLWAATAGDIGSMRDMLFFDEATLAKARTWFESLPASSRAQYRTPEDLVVGVTLGSIHPTEAQVSWLHQRDTERAIVGLLLANPESPVPPASTLSYQPAAEGLPPGLRESGSPYRVVVLNLQRAPDGWRIKVPATAIGGMARWLGSPGGG